MSKIVLDSKIIEERGVNAFRDYCNKHNPYIIFREESTHDYGIDGEIELTFINDLGKREPSGEILKIQIKSTETGSYIKNEKEDSFEFHARQDDLLYWEKHSLSVILVVFDARINALYAKKVSSTDYSSSKSRKALLFGKSENSLEVGDNSFVSKYSKDFRSRVNFDVNEVVATNIFRFSKLPKFMYFYKTKVKKAKEIFTAVERSQIPTFIIKEKSIYSMADPSSFKSFWDNTAIDKAAKPQFDYFTNYLKDNKRRNYCIELLNNSFRNFTFQKGIYYNRDFNRYYFGIKKNEKERNVTYSTRNQRNMSRSVVKYYEYIVTKFYKHFGFELDYFFNDDGLFLAINPKYLFTEDGRSVLENKKKVTELTSFIKRKEHNPQMLNHVHFIFNFLSGQKRKFMIENYAGSTIELAKYVELTTNFGIPLDSDNISETVDDSIQMTLFENHED
jgi:hypothetical protein